MTPKRSLPYEVALEQALYRTPIVDDSERSAPIPLFDIRVAEYSGHLSVAIFTNPAKTFNAQLEAVRFSDVKDVLRIARAFIGYADDPKLAPELSQFIASNTTHTAVVVPPHVQIPQAFWERFRSA